jgi:hypothetical protein
MPDQTPESKRESAEEPHGKGLSSSVLLAFAESKEDSEMTIYCAEAYLLGKIAETSSDLVKGREWEEFREACGGMGCLEAAHAAAVRAWEQWHADSEG